MANDNNDQAFKDAYAWLESVEDQITKELDKQIQAVGDDLARVIARRTRAGYGSNDGAKERLAPKKDGTASRLTDTGALLNSLHFEKGEGLEGVVTVSPSQAGKALGLTTGEAGNHYQAPRPFIGATKEEQARVLRSLKTAVFHIISKLRKP